MSERRAPGGPERARLFAALALPELVSAALHQWCSTRLGEVPGLRLSSVPELHVTLCFLGLRPVEHLDEIAVACGAVSRCPRAVLSLGEPVWLPERRPRVVAVALEDRGGALAHTQSELAAALQAGGWYEPERRPFRPHVTVARASRNVRLRAIDLARPAPISFVGSSIVLMRSHLGRGGARYERLTEVTLA